MRCIKWKNGYKQLRWHVCVPALSSACMNFTAQAAIIRCVQSWWLEEFFFFPFSPPTEETFAGSLWSKSLYEIIRISFFSCLYDTSRNMTRHTHTQSSLRRQSVFGLDVMGMRLEVWQEALFCSLLKLLFDVVNHWSRLAPPAPPSHLKMWYPFLSHSRGGWCGAVPHYSSVKCCFWALAEHWVSANRVGKAIERCHSTVQGLRLLLHSIKALASPSWTSLLSSAFGTISLLFYWTRSSYRFSVFWKLGEGVDNRECSACSWVS